MPRELALILVAGAVVVGGISVVVLMVPPTAPSGALPVPTGTVVELGRSNDSYAASYNFAWGSGAYLEGSWTATAATRVTVVPRLNCVYCPLMRIYQTSGRAGTFNLTFGGEGWEYPNMTVRFSSSIPNVVWVVQSIQVVYPPMTVLYAAGTVLNGTGLQAHSFSVEAPGAFLVGSWAAVNTTFESYTGTPQEPTSCAPWGPDSPPLAYQGSFNSYLTPGTYAVGVASCSTRPWTVLVTATIGIFYP